MLRLEHLYRRRIPVEKVISAELARTCTELSHEIRRQIGLVITRRGLIEQVIVGNNRELILTDLSKFRTGPRSLRGVRLVHTHLHNEPLSHDDLTDLALLRLDLIVAVGVAEDGLPADLYLAHMLPPNSSGQVYQVWDPVPFHAFQFECNTFVDDLEGDLAKSNSSHMVKEGHESAILISVSTKSRAHQEERLEELVDLARSDGITVLETIVQRVQDIHPKYLLGSGKLREVVIKALQQGADLLVFDQDLTPAQVRAIAAVTEMKVIDRTQLILDIFARRAHSREGKIQVELAQLRYLLPPTVGPRRGAFPLRGRDRRTRSRRDEIGNRIGGKSGTASTTWSVNCSPLHAIETSDERGGLASEFGLSLLSAIPMRANRHSSTR